MKLPENFSSKIGTAQQAGKFNTWLFVGISMLWGHMLDLLSPWFIPLTILIIIMSYGSEVKPTEEKTLKI